MQLKICLLWFVFFVILYVDINDGLRKMEIFNQIIENITVASRQYGLKEPNVPEIVAVSKTFPVEKIIPVLEKGHKVFGENRVQEALEKWPGLKNKFTETELHLIGPLQTNKVNDAVKLFDVIETLDREKLAKEFVKLQDKGAELPDLLIQVNTGMEEQKAGIDPEQADEFIDYCKNKLNLPVKGLMCIPPIGEEPAPHFALLKMIADRNNLKILSMGMSSDYEIAAAIGATHIRLGTAIFGPRG